MKIVMKISTTETVDQAVDIPTSLKCKNVPNFESNVNKKVQFKNFI